MNIKAKTTKKQAKAQNSSINVLSAEKLSGKVEAIKKELKSYTWRDLETNGKFINTTSFPLSLTKCL